MLLYDPRNNLGMLLDVSSDLFWIGGGPLCLIFFPLRYGFAAAAHPPSSPYLERKLYLVGTFLLYLLITERFRLAKVACYSFPVSPKRLQIRPPISRKGGRAAREVKHTTYSG